MTIKQLSWQETQPNLEHTASLSQDATLTTDFLTLQPRVKSTLSLLCPANRRPYQPKFMLLKAPDSQLVFSLLQDSIKSLLPPNNNGFAYHIYERKITLAPAKSKQDNFAATDNCLFASMLDNESLFGCLRQPEDDTFKLQPGLVHNANGGVLILGLRTLLAQPSIWLRLKNMVINGEYQWFSTDDSNPLPIAIPPMPLDLRIILVGDRLSMADLQDFEPEFYNSALYAELEDDVLIKSDEDTKKWSNYLRFLANYQQLPPVDNSAFNELIKEGVRYTEDQNYLPLSPDWLNTLLTNVAQTTENLIDSAAVKNAIAQKNWRESYLIDRFRDAIFTNQIIINTQDQIIGQINGLSVIEYPGYPKAIGEPTRLSCLIHFGDGEFIDIERKNELAGNIHSKGMMIMQSFITAEFAITHQLPFSASLVFEQSYNEVDGDSASLAGLCVLISALASQPIDQQLAVTGSVDQFGNVQAIGGVNEKIAGFFAICQHQGLTGQQGVIIPASNQRHLCLNDDIIEAVRNGKFSIWTVDNVAEALYLLTGIPYRDETTINLYKLIQTRIQLMMNQERRPNSWLQKWLK
ncbi:Lon protease family protein [Orbus sturtevantii]|uniref:AAA family ATPase n=1 Tax=Orbus sturtevantii TaxID=3074109 RepID=UPI00370D590F